MSGALLQIENLTKHFPVRRGILNRSAHKVHAVTDVSFDIGVGEVVGLVGESGSGKSTLGRSILRLIEPTSGSIVFKGMDITRLKTAQMRPFRHQMQIIFQDPFSSLDPRMTVGKIVGEAIEIHRLAPRAQITEEVGKLLLKVGLSPEHMARYPHQFSGGQRQRIGIARALAVNPSFLIADEPVSALDVSVQAQVVNLLRDLQKELHLSILFISHDLTVVEFLCDRVIVMYGGRIMEVAPNRELYAAPRHPYTEALLSASPVVDPALKRNRILLKGEVPSPLDPPSGCVFRTRCQYAIPECAAVIPELRQIAPGHFKACIRDVL